MFDLRSTYSGIRFVAVARHLAGLVLFLVLVASITALAPSIPEVAAEIGNTSPYTRVVPVPEYPNVSPTARSAWGR